MKSIIRVPLDQYAYTEVEFEGTEKQIIEKYRELTNLYKNEGIGIPTKDFNFALDTYLGTNNISEETYNSMSLPQQSVIQEIKKAFKRMDKQTPEAMEALYNGTDNAAEHKFHDEYDEKCSECCKRSK